MPLVNKTFDQLLDFTRTSAATFVGSNGLIQTTPASANLLTFTQEFDNAAWSKTAATVTANSTVAPDGTSTADTLVATAGTGNHHIQQNLASTGISTLSAFVRAGTTPFAQILMTAGSGSTVWFTAIVNLSTGAITQTAAGALASLISSSITDVGGGWYRVSITGNSSLGVVPRIAVVNAASGLTFDAGGNVSWTAAGTETVFIWGAQTEAVPDANLVLGSELVTNGGFATDTNWTKGAGWTISSGAAQASAGAFSAITQSISFTAGRSYRVSFDVTAYSAGNIRASFTGGTQVTGAARAATGQYIVYMTAVTGNNLLAIGADGSGFTGTIDNVTVKEITATTGMPTTYTRNNGGRFPPRFDFDPATLAPRGLLIEEQRVNRTLQSEDFTVSPWAATVVGTSTRVNTNTALGFMRGLVTATSANGGIRQTYSGLASGQVYALSFYIQSTTTAVSVFMENGTVSFGGPHSVTINPSNGTAGALTGFTSVTITPFSSGYIYTLITAPAGGTLLANFEWRIVTSGDSFQYGRPQFEAGAFATSYIPTVASQVTRTADVTSIVAPNFAPWYNQSEGTLVFEGSRLTNSGFSYPVVATDNSNSNRFGFYQSGSTVAGFISNTGVTQLETTSSPIVANVPFKMALAAQANNGNFSFNGNIGTNDTTITMPTVNRLFLGAGVAGANDYLNGHIRSIRYYPTRLTNAQLQALTA